MKILSVMNNRVVSKSNLKFNPKESKQGALNDLFDIQDVSTPKVGKSYILTPKDSEFKNLKILYNPDECNITSVNPNIRSDISFTGTVYGSIRNSSSEGTDNVMIKAYDDFFNPSIGIKSIIQKNSQANLIKDDYNFYIPTDGDGTRYKDISILQGGKAYKPATKTPIQLNGYNLKLNQCVLANFAKTGKLDDFKPLLTEPGKGSAYAFLEGLKNGDIPTDKPIVFSWGDNFSDINISNIIVEHEKNNAAMTIFALHVDEEQAGALSAVKITDDEQKSILDFVEKPKKEDLEKFKLDNGLFLASVGPFIISTKALKWIKDNYTKTPELFCNKSNSYDFSTGVIGNLLTAAQNGELCNENGEWSDLKVYVKPDNESWSDLGRRKDLKAMCHSIKSYSYSMASGNFSDKTPKKQPYANLADFMKNSIINHVDTSQNIYFADKTKKIANDFADKYGLKFENCIFYSED